MSQGKVRYKSGPALISIIVRAWREKSLMLFLPPKW